MGLLDYADEAGKRFLGLLGNMPLVQLLKAGQGEAPAPDVSPNALANTLRSIPVFQNSDQSNQDVANNLLNAVNPIGLLGKIVYHGSPHKFDKFDASKIGTGEGAQAYGHGVYLAESPDVAKTYSTVDRPMLQRLPVKDGKPYEAKTLAEFKASNVLQATGDYEKALARIERDMDGLRSNVRSLSADGRGQPYVEIGNDVAGELRDLQQAKAALLNMRQGGVSIGPDYSPGLYKADLPDEWIPKMLDWDKPLSEQSKEVISAIRDIPARDGSGFTFGQLYDAIKADPKQAKTFDVSGKDIYTSLAIHKSPPGVAYHRNASVGQADASTVFGGLGIPGIKYLDGGSRGAGQGTHNYVIFPGLEDQVKILERNGIPLNGLLGQ